KSQRAAVAKLADAPALGAGGREAVWVRLPPAARRRVVAGEDEGSLQVKGSSLGADGDRQGRDVGRQTRIGRCLRRMERVEGPPWKMPNRTERPSRTPGRTDRRTPTARSWPTSTRPGSTTTCFAPRAPSPASTTRA